MFTGIIEEMAQVVALENVKENLHITLKTNLTSELRIDQSIAHNGVCLTVIDINDNTYTVTAIQETLQRSNLLNLRCFDWINLERSMQINGRLDGHIVQGHVDITASCVSIVSTDGSWKYHFNYDPSPEHITVSKGSITINGVSLTVVDSEPSSFSVALIPYTQAHTNFKFLTVGGIVNLEFDIIGKYITRYLSQIKS